MKSGKNEQLESDQMFAYGNKKKYCEDIEMCSACGARKGCFYNKIQFRPRLNLDKA